MENGRLALYNVLHFNIFEKMFMLHGIIDRFSKLILKCFIICHILSYLLFMYIICDLLFLLYKFRLFLQRKESQRGISLVI